MRPLLILELDDCMYDKVFKIKYKAHAFHRFAFDLAQTMLPRDLHKFSWFWETTNAMQRFQKNVILEEQRREDVEKIPILKKLEPELKELKKIADK